jgi:hypothetical protein
MWRLLLLVVLVCGCTAAQYDAAAKSSEKVKAGAEAVTAVTSSPAAQLVSALAPPAAPVISGLGELAAGTAGIAAALALYFRQKAADHREAAATAKAERNSALDRLDAPARKAALQEAALTVTGNGRLVIK